MAGFLEKNIGAFARAMERAVASESSARERGFLQAIDPRLKIVALAAMVLACSLARGALALAVLYAIASLLAVASRIPLGGFTRRVWIFVPLFTGIVAIPALFLTPGSRVASLGPVAITAEGARTALFLVLRTAASVSFAILLVLTTRWDAILEALRRLRLPAIVVSLLALCWRYLLLLARGMSEILLARRSRIVAPMSFAAEAAFASRSAGVLFLKSLHLADGVHLAMVARGWDGGEETGRAREQVPPAGGAAAPGGAAPRPDLFTPGSVAGYNAFELEGIVFSYPGGGPVVRIDRLDIPAGRCTVLLGANGSGKSTILKLLDGLVFPQAGTVTAYGVPVTERSLEDGWTRRAFRTRVGLVFQDPDVQCFSPTVRDELAFGPRQLGFDEAETTRRVEAALHALRIEGIADRYPYRLSGGEKKRVALASILTMDLEAFLLDEPTASLDPATEGILIDILNGLARYGKTFVVATQDLLLARHIGDEAVVLGAGGSVVYAGPVEAALDDAAMLERAGLAHAHRFPHRRAATEAGHSHRTEAGGNRTEVGDA